MTEMSLSMRLRRAGILLGVFAVLLVLAACQSKSVPDAEAPVVKFTQPLTGDTVVSGVYELKAFATDNVRVVDVVFWTEGEMLGFIEYQPSDTYEVGVDTRSDTSGTGQAYTLLVEADDAAHNMGWDSVTVYIHR
jgi:hypothetical protein